MNKYDPNKAPNPDDWNALDEGERIHLIERYHKKSKISMPNHQLHAAIHAVVENQIAIGDELPVAHTLERLMSEGLDRHDALHAIGSVLAEHLHGLMKGQMGDPEHDRYFRELDELTAEKWNNMGQP